MEACHGFTGGLLDHDPEEDTAALWPIGRCPAGDATHRTYWVFERKGFTPLAGLSLNCFCHSKTRSHFQCPLGRCFKLKVLFSCSLPAFRRAVVAEPRSTSCLCSLSPSQNFTQTIRCPPPGLSVSGLFPGVFRGRLAPASPVTDTVHWYSKSTIFFF